MNYLIEQQMKRLSITQGKVIDRSISLRERVRPLYRNARKIYFSLNDLDVKLPDFLIIGNQKCGTSSLHHYLSLHPKVWTPAKKELHYYDYDYDYGLPFYKSFFKKQPKDVNNLLVGEATPEYIFHPYAAERIKETLSSNVKAIVLLRSPVERAFSAWRMGVRQKWETLGFDEAIEAEGDRVVSDLTKLASDKNYYGYNWNHHTYLLRGHYYDQIQNWLLHFEQKNLLILSSERFFTDTKTEFKKVCDFLEINEWYPDKFQNMFVGIDGDLSRKTRERLNTYFKPYNQDLYDFISDDYGW